jgi:hypothetical protein
MCKQPIIMGDRRRIAPLFCLGTNLARNRTAICSQIRTRVQIRERFRFYAQFAWKPDRDPILHLTHITLVCLYISANTLKNLLALHLWQQIVHRIVRRFERKIARVDGP